MHLRLLVPALLLALLVPTTLGLPFPPAPPDNDAGTGQDAPEEPDDSFLIQPMTWYQARFGGPDTADVFAVNLTAAGGVIFQLYVPDRGEICVTLLPRGGTPTETYCDLTWTRTYYGWRLAGTAPAGISHLRVHQQSPQVGADTPLGRYDFLAPLNYEIMWRV